MNEAIFTKAFELVRRSETCLLGSIDSNGFPAIRAMLQPREIEGMKTLYFSTNTSSRHVAEFRQNDKASVYFYDPNLFQGFLLRGRIQVRCDQECKNRLWRDGDNVYYQLGPTDPDYCALLFTAQNGRWYEDFKKTDIDIK